MTYVPSGTATDTRHSPQFVGEVWYTDDVGGLDTNDGHGPTTAFKTIGKGFLSMASGDALTVKAGTYTELGLDLGTGATKDSVEVWCELGVVIDPVSGTAITMSGDFCRWRGPSKITPAALAIGIDITGAECIVEEVNVLGGGTGIKTIGMGTQLRDCAAGLQTSISYDIQGDTVRLESCKTVGIGASIGYKISGGVDTGVLSDCTSSGHTTAGYYIDTLSSNWTIVDCSSGGGDGRWVDVDSANTWPGFNYDEEKSHETDWSVVGGAAGSDNLFQVTGSVQILGIRGHVETILHADIDTIQLDLYDGAATNITTTMDPVSAPVGSIFTKEDKSDKPLELYSSAAATLMQDVDLKKTVFGVNQKAATSTYIRATWTGTGATGVIHWHIDWEPLTEDGNVVAV